MPSSTRRRGACGAGAPRADDAVLVKGRAAWPWSAAVGRSARLVARAAGRLAAGAEPLDGTPRRGRRPAGTRAPAAAAIGMVIGPIVVKTLKRFRTQDIREDDCRSSPS
jgi:hypothetical protein